eukprot:6972138-Karenia_brevis.AAC.1
MDKQRSWNFIHPESSSLKALRTGCNLLICSDGGKRESGEAAAAWVAYLVTRNSERTWHFSIFAQMGILLESSTTPFLAEALALQSAIEYVSNLIRQV